MKTLIAAVLVSLLLGLGVGGYLGWRMGSSHVINLALAKDARDVLSRVNTLKDLRAGRMEPALVTIENGMDDILIAFDPQTPYQGLDSGTTMEIKKAIQEAKAYRSAHPWSTEPGSQMRGKMVRSLFERTPN